MKVKLYDRTDDALLTHCTLSSPKIFSFSYEKRDKDENLACCSWIVHHKSKCCLKNDRMGKQSATGACSAYTNVCKMQCTKIMFNRNSKIISECMLSAMVIFVADRQEWVFMFVAYGKNNANMVSSGDIPTPFHFSLLFERQIHK